VLIDGGKGQLDAAIRARDEAGCAKIPFIGLAKREEQIVIKKGRQSLVSSRQSKQQPPATGHPQLATTESAVTLNEPMLQKLGGFKTESDDFVLVNVPHSTNLVKLLQRIRDESHRFAVSYHSVLKQKRQTSSILDDIPGIGPATRKKLIRHFGSLRGVRAASQAELAGVVGPKLARSITAQGRLA